MIRAFSCSLVGIFTSSSIKDLNWERVEQLTSLTTSYVAIKYFTENAGTGLHPCVVVEIVLKWWSVRTDRGHVDMSFIKPPITTIENVSSWWYYSVCSDQRYKGLMKTLDIAVPTADRYMFYSNAYLSNNNRRVQEDCISKGDGTPAQLEYFNCTDNIKRYRQSVPAFRYNAAVFPPYGDAKHNWYIRTLDPVRHVSLITNSKQEILDDINNTFFY